MPDALRDQDVAAVDEAEAREMALTYVLRNLGWRDRAFVAKYLREMAPGEPALRARAADIVEGR